MEFINTWEREHEGLKKVTDSPDQALLIKMHIEGYIQLTAAPNGSLYYSQENLAQAKMWETKLK